MNEFRDKVAVITGAASGIGLALAEHAANEGMRVVLADIEQPALDAAEARLRAAGVEVFAIETDVSEADQVQRLADAAVEQFSAIHLVCNNAGVALTAPLWEYDLSDWQWLLGVNLWGVIHGIRSFVPILRRQREPSAFVSTASLFGLVSPPGYGIYNATKHAVVALSETLAGDLAAAGSHQVQVAVLCPGVINTRVVDSVRNRPADLPAGVTGDPGFQARVDSRRHILAAGMDPARVAEIVFNGLRKHDFYLFTHPEENGQIERRLAGILNGKLAR